MFKDPIAPGIHLTENNIQTIQTNSTHLFITSFISTAICTFFQLLKNCIQHTKSPISFAAKELYTSNRSKNKISHFNCCP